MQCTLCHTENDQFATTCSKCGGFLQNRVPNLDLFETFWLVIESPKKAFQRIALAEHKNFAIFLFMLFGIGCSFAALWLFRAGDRFDSLLELIIWGIVAGGAVGLLLHPVASLVHMVVVRMLGSRRGYRDALGLTSYSLVPVILSVLLVLPIELLTFGMYMFTGNPHPYTINPVSYIVLVGIDGVCALWTILLLAYGTSVIHQIGRGRAFVGAGATVLLVVAALYWIGSSFLLHPSAHGVVAIG